MREEFLFIKLHLTDRAKPKDIGELMDRLANAAETLIEVGPNNIMDSQIEEYEIVQSL